MNTTFSDGSFELMESPDTLETAPLYEFNVYQLKPAERGAKGQRYKGTKKKTILPCPFVAMQALLFDTIAVFLYEGT